MYFEANKSILYSDTLVPDIFITEYLPSMSGDCVKVYIYCLFLGKHNIKASTEELAKKLDLSIDRVKDALTYLENVGVIKRNNSGMVMVDLKEKEINKLYRLKLTSTPEEAILSSERNKKRSQIISAINNTFFQGVMSPSWYTDIDAWFDKYQFEEDVMYALFQHCYDYKGLSKSYITKVADNWHSKNIRNSIELDRYFMEYQKFKDIKVNIAKKLKLSRNLTEYEEEYIEKWVMDYGFDFNIIEQALKKTTSKTNPNFKYLHSLLADWHEKGLKSVEEIIEYEKARKESAKAKSQPASARSLVPQKENYEQRDYGDDYYESFYKNVKNRARAEIPRSAASDKA